MTAPMLAEDIRAALQAIATAPDTQVIMSPLDGERGMRVKRVGAYYVDVLEMGFNFRLVTTPVDSPLTYDRFWCYAGKSRDVLFVALLAAIGWDGLDGTEPAGWDKNGQTQEYGGKLREQERRVRERAAGRRAVEA